jgi:FkbM family methyltransferase
MRILSQMLFRIGTKFLPVAYLRDIGRKTIIQNINSHTRMKIRVNSFDKQALYEIWGMNEYENEIFTIGRQDVIVDIGAHIGAFSVWAAQKAISGRVLAFEPNPDNFSLLEENRKLNRLANLSNYKIAASKGRGQAKLYSSEYHNMTHSFFEADARDYNLVPTLGLADIFDDYGLKRVHYLKIDAEGAEYDIILNAPREIMGRIDKVFIEYHDYLNHGRGHKELEAFLAGNGFVINIGASAFHRHILKLGLIQAHRPLQ